MFSLSILAYALPENNSILRFDSKKLDGTVVYAVANGDSVYALTEKDPFYINNLANSLWIVRLNGNGFTIQNLGTGKFLNQSSYKGSVGASKGSIHYPILSDNALVLSEGDKGFYYEERDYGNKAQAYIQYDPVRESWRFYTVGANFPHDPKKDSQANGAWTDADFPQASVANSLEIKGSDVETMVGANGNWELDQIKKNIIVDFIERKDLETAPTVSIVVGESETYPFRNYWKTDNIKLNVTYEDWTPVSFPVDVKCVTANLSGVGYQEYSTAKRANGESAWVTNYVTSDKVFERGVAYHFATDSEVMTLDFRPITGEDLTKVEKSYSKTLTATNGNIITNQNWYYIGNALFVDAGMTGIDMISRYNRAIGKWEEEPVSDAVDPFDAFFVQYSGDYAMSASSERTNAPMRDRKVVTEKYCLNIVGEGVEDKTYLYFEDEALAEGYVIGEDFLSFATIGGANTEIYTYAGDIDYSFNTRPIENTLVYVGLYIAKAGTYTISLDNISGNAETFVLYDNYEQDFVRLHLGETYTFYSERGEFNDRFGVAVTYAPEVPTDNISLSANKLIVVNNEIQGLTLGSELVVYDAMGHLVYVANVDSETMILPNLNSGIYIARNGNGWAKFLVK